MRQGAPGGCLLDPLETPASYREKSMEGKNRILQVPELHLIPPKVLSHTEGNTFVGKEKMWIFYVFSVIIIAPLW